MRRSLLHTDHRKLGATLKALSETGYARPRRILPFTDELLALLSSRHNRLVWGSMDALCAVAPVAGKRLYARRALLQHAIVNGSVITRDKGIRTLAIVASQNARYRRELLPFLLEHLRRCRAQDVPQHGESIALAVDSDRPGKTALVAVLQERLPGMRPARAKRISRLIKRCDGTGVKR